MADLEERVRRRAYTIWVEEGRPEGREQAHWDLARKLIAVEDKSTEDKAAKDKSAADKSPPQTAKETFPGHVNSSPVKAPPSQPASETAPRKADVPTREGEQKYPPAGKKSRPSAPKGRKS